MCKFYFVWVKILKIWQSYRQLIWIHNVFTYEVLRRPYELVPKCGSMSQWVAFKDTWKVTCSPFHCQPTSLKNHLQALPFQHKPKNMYAFLPSCYYVKHLIFAWSPLRVHTIALEMICTWNKIECSQNKTSKAFLHHTWCGRMCFELVINEATMHKCWCNN